MGGASWPSRGVGGRAVEHPTQQPDDMRPRRVLGELDEGHARAPCAVTDHPPLGQPPPQHHPTDPRRPRPRDEVGRGLGGVDGDPEDEVTPLAHQALRRLGQGEVVDAGTPGGDHHAQQPAADGVREVLDRDRA